MRRLTICLSAFLLTCAMVVAQDLSSAAQQSSSISQDSTTAASGEKSGAGVEVRFLGLFRTSA